MKKRVISLFLAAILMLSLFAGCGDPDKQTAAPGKTPDKGTAETESDQLLDTKFAYKAEFTPLEFEEGLNLNYIDGFCVSGNNLYFVATFLSGDGAMMPMPRMTTGMGGMAEAKPVAPGSIQSRAYVTNLDTMEMAEMTGYAPTALPEGMDGSSFIAAMTGGTDGTVWIAETVNTYSYNLPEGMTRDDPDAMNYYVPGEREIYLRQFDAQGQELTNLPLPLPANQYLQSVLAGEDGTIYVAVSGDVNAINLYDTAGTLLGSISNDSYGELAAIGANAIGFITYNQDYSARIFKQIDPTAMAYGKEITLDVGAARIFPGVEEYQYIYDGGMGIFGYNEATGESEKLFSWLDCDVNGDNVRNYTILADGRVVALEMDNYADDKTPQLVVLNRVDASTLPQKNEIVLAAMYLPWGMQTDIVNFNRAHDDVRIVVKNYSEYNTQDDYTAGLTKLNTEILSGQVPDILVTSGLPIDQYAAKGILADLWPMIDNDAELSRDDLMTHLLDVMSIDGKLYQVSGSFTIQTVSGRKDIVGDRTSWTLDELLAALETMPEGASIFGEQDIKSGILNSCINFNLGSFIDWTTGQCSFDTQNFIDMLTFANSFPAEFDYNNYDWETAESEYSRLNSGKQMLFQSYISGFEWGIPYIKAMHGSDVSFVGYPSDSGTGNAFTVSDGLAISASSKYPEQAWSFVRTLLADETVGNVQMGFPVNRHAFEAMAQKAMTPQYELDPVTGEAKIDPETGEKVEAPVFTTGMAPGVMVEIYAMTQEEYDNFMELYESCNTLTNYNKEITDIITEEVQPFFDGQKTAEETAALIQNRVSLYVAEQG